MKTTHRFVFLLGLSIRSGIAVADWSTNAQTTARADAQPALPKLTGDDARRAEELEKATEAAIKADRWDEVIARGN